MRRFVSILLANIKKFDNTKYGEIVDQIWRESYLLFGQSLN